MKSAEQFLSHNGAKIWFKRAGPDGAPPLYFLHGGPGYNSYSFEKSAGIGLEERLNMTYFDQRACGRSTELSRDCPLSIEAIVEDIEALRIQNGHETISLLGHSFGGLLALEYLLVHPNRVNKIILIDCSPDLAATVDHQLSFIAKVAPRAFPEESMLVEQIAGGSLPRLDKLRAIYRLVDEDVFSKELFWHDTRGMKANIELDRESLFFKHEISALIKPLEKSGYFTSPHPEISQRLAVPGIIFAGRSSQCVGEKNIEAAANSWGIPIVWFDESGHMPYIEETQAFVDAVFSFMLS